MFPNHTSKPKARKYSPEHYRIKRMFIDMLESYLQFENLPSSSKDIERHLGISIDIFIHGECEALTGMMTPINYSKIWRFTPTKKRYDSDSIEEFMHYTNWKPVLIHKSSFNQSYNHVLVGRIEKLVFKMSKTDLIQFKPGKPVKSSVLGRIIAEMLKIKWDRDFQRAFINACTNLGYPETDHCNTKLLKGLYFPN